MSNTAQADHQQLPPQLSVVIPAFNEETRIGATLDRIFEYLDGAGYSYELMVVDDGSTDSTISTVERHIAGRPNARLLHYDGNRGKGYAVRFGIMQAAGDFVLFSDADLATPIEEVERLFGEMKDGKEIAIASRDLPGSHLTRRQSPLRELGGKLFNRCVQWVACPGIHDTQCGFKLFTRAAAQNIFSRCQIDNFSFDVEAIYLGLKLGYSIAEVPVTWEHKEGSKVSLRRDAPRMVATLFRLRRTEYDLKRAAPKRTSIQ